MRLWVVGNPVDKVVQGYVRKISGISLCGWEIPRTSWGREDELCRTIKALGGKTLGQDCVGLRTWKCGCGFRKHISLIL